MQRSRIPIMTIGFWLLFMVNIDTGFALTLWQYGIENQSASEYNTADGVTFDPVTNISLGNVSIDSPVNLTGSNLPGHFNVENPTANRSYGATNATEVLSIDFTLETDYRKLELSYGRFGSEIDFIFFDDEQISIVDGAAETQWELFNIDILGYIGAGEHTLTISYAGGGTNTGHYIDFLRLDNGIPADDQPAPIPEPSTFLLLGTGLGLLVRLKRRSGQSR